MADKRLDQENVLTDFDYALIVKGTDVAKISKADLAKVVGGLIGKASDTKDGLFSAAEHAETFINRSIGGSLTTNEQVDKAFTPGSYMIAGSVTNVPSYTLMAVFHSAMYYCQIFVGMDHSEVSYRACFTGDRKWGKLYKFKMIE